MSRYDPQSIAAELLAREGLHLAELLAPTDSSIDEA